MAHNGMKSGRSKGSIERPGAPVRDAYTRQKLGSNSLGGSEGVAGGDSGAGAKPEEKYKHYEP